MQSTPTNRRYALILNIGLLNNPLGSLLGYAPAEGDYANMERALGDALAYHMQSSGGLTLGSDMAVLYRHHRGNVAADWEPTLVVSLDVFTRAYVNTDQAAYDEVKNRVHALADALNQDAIAGHMRDLADDGQAYPDKRFLAGRAIELYGDFDRTKFHLLDSDADGSLVPSAFKRAFKLPAMVSGAAVAGRVIDTKGAVVGAAPAEQL